MEALIVIIIIAIPIILFTKFIAQLEPEETIICPICENETVRSNISNAKFNNDWICKDCIEKINELRGGEFPLQNVYLEELQKMIEDYNNYSIEELRQKYPCLDNKFGKASKLAKMNFGMDATDRVAYSVCDENEKCLISIDNAYSDIVIKHYKNIEKMDMLYSTAINMPNINNKATDRCIALCLQDIELALEFKKYCEMRNKYLEYEEELPNYPSFYYLTQLYTKLEDIDSAINVCKKAVDLGYYRDGTKGGMPARLARLLKKKGKEKGDKRCQQPQ